MSRNDLRSPYPFHLINPRAHVACCKRPTYKRGLRHWLLAKLARVRLALGL